MMAALATSFDFTARTSAEEELTGYCPCCQQDTSMTYDTSVPYALEDAKAELTRKHLASRFKRHRMCKGLLIFS